MSEAPPNPTRPIGKVIAVVFLVALILGPGPGARLFDGTADQPNFLMGVPVLYVWVVFWFLVMAGCVVVAARTMWKDED
ncbi:MAG: hypothetical protein OSB41_06235 [Kiritimatiellae bacterium]|nr:hypothetical protein [Kiritimatiellia bacterium]